MVQRVSRASVTVGAEVVGRIEHGLVVLVGVSGTDTEDDARVLGAKIVGLRLFANGAGLLNRDVREVGGAVLVVSQFTLLGDTRRGRRPSFTQAAPPTDAAPLVEHLVAAISGAGVAVQTGVFGAEMKVDLVNDGPVTMILRVEEARVL